MQPTTFHYTIFIAAKASTVWNGLRAPEVTSKYWGHHNVSDWFEGADWSHVRSDGSGVEDVSGKVLECCENQKLRLTWRFLGEAHEKANLDRSHDGPSEVTITLTALGPDCKLDVQHTGLLPDAPTREGWPAVFSNLKTYLETGKTLSDDQWGDAKPTPEA